MRVDVLFMIVLCALHIGELAFHCVDLVCNKSAFDHATGLREVLALDTIGV
jgi:hypothetical protein